MGIKCFCLFAAFMLCGSTTAEYMRSEPDKYSKTSVTDDGCFRWSAGAEIWQHATGGGVEVVRSAGVDTVDATFAYGPYVDTMSGKAVYPYSGKYAISDFVPGSVTSNTNALMYTGIYGGNFKFSHIAGVMNFDFNEEL